MLDFPGVNCEQCKSNLKEDGQIPDCDGCKIKNIPGQVFLTINAWSFSSPSGEIDSRLLKEFLLLNKVPRGKHLSVIESILIVDREVKKHQENKQGNQPHG